jgi:predicted PurR-regulated permease PerM
MANAAWGLRPSLRGEKSLVMQQTAKRTAVATLVVLGIVALALALWKLKLVIALLFLGFIIAAAMRPGIDALRRRGIPRGFGLLFHYLGLFALVGLFLWIVVPRAIDQVQSALKADTKAEIHREATHSKGIRHEVLTAVDKRLRNLPKAAQLVHPAVEATKRAFEVVLGIFFTLAVAAYWIFERQRAVDFVASLLPRPKRKTMRDTWDLIDLKLGAFVRGQLLLVILVGTVLSLAFMAVGEPYFILIGAFAGIVEIVPVIGPLAAGALAIGVGFTDSWQTALAAGLCVLGVRLLEDYLIIPRVLGEAVGMSPLLVLVSVTAIGILFGGYAVVLAVPIAAVLVTLVDVIVRDKDPAAEEVPTVLFPAKEAEN